MKNIFSKMVLVLAVLFSAVVLSGCGGGKTAKVVESNTTQQQSDKNGTEVTVEPENYRYLVNQSGNTPHQVVRYKAEEVSDYHSLLWSLSDEVRGVVVSNPKLVLILLNYFGDEYLATQTKRSLVALKDFATRAKEAYGVVNSKEFNQEMKKYRSFEREYRDGNISWGTLWNQEKIIAEEFKNSADAKAYYRRFSVKWNSCNETWKDILRLFEKKVDKALAEVEENPDVLVTFEQPKKGYYVIDKEGWQEVTKIRVDTSYSSESVSIYEIKAELYSWKGTGELDQCRIVNPDMKNFVKTLRENGFTEAQIAILSESMKYSDNFYIEDLGYGIEVSIYQDRHQIRQYSLECWVDDGVVDRNSVSIYNGSVDFEFQFAGHPDQTDILKSVYLRGVSSDDETVVLKAEDFKKQLEGVADSEEKQEVLKLLNYFINDSYGAYGDGWSIYRDELINKNIDGLTGKVLDMGLIDWVYYFQDYKH